MLLMVRIMKRKLGRAIVVLAMGGTALVGSGLGSGHAVAVGETLVTLDAPQRIADTRPTGETVDNQFEKTGAVAGGQRLELQISGRAGIAVSAPAVVLNVTVVGSQGPGFLTVYPCDKPLPLGANINYTQGQVIANAVFAKLDPSGRACFYTSATTHMVVDVTGALPGDSFAALAAPARLLDTRPLGEVLDNDSRFEKTGRLGAAQTFELQVAGRVGIAADARFAVLNVASVRPDGNGFITVYPCDQPLPTAANLTYVSGQVIANSVVARLDGNGKTCIYTLAGTDVVVDATGTLGATAYAALASPVRLFDSRPVGETIDNIGEKTLARRPGTTLELPVAGRAGIPTNASAVVLNIAVTQAKGPGYVTVHPRNSARPNSANLNFKAGEVIANTVVAKIGGNGRVCMFTSAFTELVVDVAGYFTGPAAVDTGEDCPFEFPAYSLPTGTREEQHHLVGEFQMRPGRYVGTGNRADGYGRCDVYKYAFFGDFFSADDGSRGSAFSFQNSRLIIDVLPTDRYVNWQGYDCTPLLPYEPGAFAPVNLDQARGMHVVGDQIQPGTYELDSGNCDFERLRSFTGQRSVDRISINQTLFEGRGILVTVQPSDVGVRMSVDCKLIKK